MISKLPRWVWAGGWVLAFVAGMINVVGLLGFEHQAVTHLTGTTSMLGVAFSTLDIRSAIHLTAVLLSFVAGCALSGFLIKDSTLKLGRHYGLALLLETILLCIAVPLLKRNNVLGIYAATSACGLQNAMASIYSGTVLRTTHLSGMFTDLGVFLGHALRKGAVDVRRLQLCLVIISGFLCGGVAGAAVFRHFDYSALFVPAAITGLISVAYSAFIFTKRRDDL